MATVASLPQEVTDQIAMLVSHEHGSSEVLKNLRLVSRPFWYSASRILFRRFYIDLENADPSCPNGQDDIMALLELSRSGASRFIRFMRVSGRSYKQTSEPTKEAELAGTIAKCLQGYMRPDLKALDFYNLSDSMLHEFSRPAMAPTIAGLRFLKVVGYPGCSNGMEIRLILQYCENVQAVEWSNCQTSFEGPTGIIHPKAPLERLRLNGHGDEAVATPECMLATVRNARNTIRYLSVYPMRWQSDAVEEQVEELVGEFNSCPFLYHPNLGLLPESLAGRYGCRSILKVLEPHTNEVIPTISPREMKCYGRYPDYWRLLQHDIVRLRKCSLDELYEYKWNPA
ncbi:hypothetical protein BDV33DRAFT_199632 [Aspergillus novoparasiticus]|uniref:F-box domain-containing protein n=1 Tax=Aspergillus novoparasiticus TaxID=986946 RepID=A0A5N6F3F0_9EURO|nr:hypothetical protein BDV33DRAFT_199632 [Aspergillus novoparasiticus]